MSTIRIAIAGATGYAGEELIRLLLNHPHVRLTCLAASAKRERPVLVSDVYPRFARQLDLPVESLDLARLSHEADAVFLALPHGTAKDLVPVLLQAGKRVIDLSGDFRLTDPAAYPQWYQFTHPHPELLGGSGVVYGLTEFHREALRAAQLVANPGCYATSVLLAVLPLLDAGVVESFFVVDAKSGYTGAGRNVKDDPALWNQTAENLRAYKVNAHQHMPEILQEIAQLTRRTAGMNFVPQVLPIARGLISTLYLKTSKTMVAIREAYEKHYSADRTPFVRVRWDALPQLKDVVETNTCEIGVVLDPAHGSLIVASAIDNLTKGAAGQAIQNLNVMYGWPETTGLLR